MDWTYHWSVRDDGLHIWENGTRVALIKPEHFVHIVAEMSAHLRWQQANDNSKAKASPLDEAKGT